MLSWLTCIIIKALALKVGKLDTFLTLGFRHSIKQDDRNRFFFFLILNLELLFGRRKKNPTNVW